jgi:actin-like ATPase involved in cell morphogenesis
MEREGEEVDRLMRHFRREYQIVITERTAHRLAETVRNMRCVDPSIQLGVTGSDEAALIPRRVDVTVADLRTILRGRRTHVA